MKRICLLAIAFVIESFPALGETIYVKPSGTGNGTSWANAMGSLTGAHNVAGTRNADADPNNNIDQIWVAAGTYSGTVNLVSGVKVYGGFASNETAASQSNPEANLTIITGAGGTRAVWGDDLDANSVLRGFRITGGVVVFDKCGAGLELVDSAAVIAACEFTGGRASIVGAGVCIDGGAPKFVNCKFYNHTDTPAAGAVFNRDGATPTFVNCLLYNNDTEEGGAVANLSGEPKFVNCTFVNNKAIVKPEVDPHFPGMGAAFYDHPGKAILRNCIVWHTLSGVSYGLNQIYNNPTPGSTTTVTYSDILTGWSGTGNINADPEFMDAANNDFRLSGPFSSTSPCRNTGNSDYIRDPLNHQLGTEAKDFADLDWDGNIAEPVPFDLTGVVPRIWQTTVDMGAYEWKKETQQQMMSGPPGPEPAVENSESEPQTTPEP